MTSTQPSTQGTIVFFREFTVEEREYRLEFGRNDNDRRVIRGFMRLVGAAVWRPVFEIDLDAWFQAGEVYSGS